MNELIKRLEAMLYDQEIGETEPIDVDHSIVSPEIMEYALQCYFSAKNTGWN